MSKMKFATDFNGSLGLSRHVLPRNIELITIRARAANEVFYLRIVCYYFM